MMIDGTPSGVEVRAGAYQWRWQRSTDVFEAALPVRLRTTELVHSRAY